MNTDPTGAAATLDRRQFLRTGFTSSAALATVSSLVTLTGCATAPQSLYQEDGQPAFLTEEDIEMLRAVTPVVLGDAMTEAQSQDMDPFLLQVDGAMLALSPENRKQVRQLFDLLTFAPTRSTVAGVWSSWPNADTETIESCFKGLRKNKI